MIKWCWLCRALKRMAYIGFKKEGQEGHYPHLHLRYKKEGQEGHFPHLHLRYKKEGQEGHYPHLHLRYLLIWLKVCYFRDEPTNGRGRYRNGTVSIIHFFRTIDESTTASGPRILTSGTWRVNQLLTWNHNTDSM